MLTKFREMTDRMANRLIDWFTTDVQAYRIDKRILEHRVHELTATVQYQDEQIKKLNARNADLEHANENLILQRAEIRRIVEKLNRYVP